MKILFIGDVVGKLGRKAVAKLLPEIKKEYQPDFIIANVENLAHGHGVTIRTMQEMVDVGIDSFTSGNHIWRNPEILEIFDKKLFPIIRPANYPSGNPGCGYQSFNISQKNIIVLNLQGRVFMRELVDNPFMVFDTVIKEIKSQKPDYIIVDFHAEATSEKNAFGLYVDGLVSAVLGTHTHTQTTDARVLDAGTAYITDVGYVGGHNTVLGPDKVNIIESYKTALPTKFKYPETGLARFNAVSLDLKDNNTITIETINQLIEI